MFVKSIVLLLCVLAAAATASPTHVIAGAGIRGVGAVHTQQFAAYDGSSFREGIPSPEVATGSVNGITAVGTNGVLLWGNFRSALGKPTTGVVFWNGASWCIPNLRFLNIDVGELSNERYAYSCARDGTMRGLEVNTTVGLLRALPCGAWPLDTDAVGKNTASINTVIVDESDANLLWFIGTFNQVNQYQANVAGLVGITYNGDAAGTFTVNWPGQPAVKNQAGSNVAAALPPTGGSQSVLYRKEELSFGNLFNPTPTTYFFDRETSNPTTFLPGAGRGATVAQGCERAYAYVVGTTRVFLCLRNGQLYRMRVPTGQGSIPVNWTQGAGGSDDTNAWDHINNGTAPFQGSGVPSGAIVDMAKKPNTNDIYVVGAFDSTYNGGGGNNRGGPNRAFRNIAKFSGFDQDIWQSSLVGGTAQEDIESIRKVGLMNTTIAEDVSGWNKAYYNEGNSPFDVGTSNANVGFDSIAFNADGSTLYVVGGWRALDANPLTNVDAGLMGTFLMTINEANTGGFGASITVQGGRLGPDSGTGNGGASSIERPKPTRGLVWGQGALHLIAPGTISLYNFQSDATIGSFFQRRFTAHIDTGYLKWQNGAWVPAFGGGFDSGITAWGMRPNGDAYVWASGLDRSYNTYANGVVVWDSNKDEFTNALLNTNRVTLRTEFDAWGEDNGGSNGAEGVLQAAAFYRGENRALVAGRFDWIGTVVCGSVALVNTETGAAEALGDGLWNVDGSVYDRAATGGTSPLKYASAGTVNSVWTTSGDAGAWVVAGGSFEATGFTGDQFSLGYSCLRNVALYSNLGGEDAAFKGKWNDIDGGCTGTVNSVLVSGGWLYVGGSFLQCGDVGASRIARIKLGSQQSVASLRAKGSKWQTLSLGVDGTVSSIIRVGGRLYVAGSFSSASGLDATEGIARWNIGDEAWESVVSECFGLCNNGRNEFNEQYVQTLSGGSVQGVNGRYPSAAFGSSSLYFANDRVYVADNGRVLRAWDGDQWNNLGQFETSNGLYPALNVDGDGNIVMINSGDTDNYIGIGENMARWSEDDNQWTPIRGIKGTPTVIAAGSALSASIALMAALLMAGIMLF